MSLYALLPILNVKFSSYINTFMEIFKYASSKIKKGCQTTGCNGSGHIDGKTKSHRV